MAAAEIRIARAAFAALRPAAAMAVAMAECVAATAVAIAAAVAAIQSVSMSVAVAAWHSGDCVDDQHQRHGRHTDSDRTDFQAHHRSVLL